MYEKTLAVVFFGIPGSGRHTRADRLAEVLDSEMSVGMIAPRDIFRLVRQSGGRIRNGFPDDPDGRISKLDLRGRIFPADLVDRAIRAQLNHVVHSRGHSPQLIILNGDCLCTADHPAMLHEALSDSGIRFENRLFVRVTGATGARCCGRLVRRHGINKNDTHGRDEIRGAVERYLKDKEVIDTLVRNYGRVVEVPHTDVDMMAIRDEILAEVGRINGWEARHTRVRVGASLGA